LIDRNCDPTLLAGSSDGRLAAKVAGLARGTRERLDIRPVDSDLGALLHHDVPFLAFVAGVPMLEGEREGNPHLGGGQTRDRSVADAARHVMRSTAYAPAMPDSCLVSDPARGNGAALLVDRVARLAGVARMDEDGPRDALASHMLEAGAANGARPVVEWSPGWPEAAGDHEADVARYLRRAFLLDDRQLAAELLEQARDARSRLAVADDGSPMGNALWQTLPAMAALFGARLEEPEGARFRGAVGRMSDQRAFEMASALVASSTDGRPPRAVGGTTIGDRAIFADPRTGSTAAFLLDRLAASLGADRGGPGDPVGAAVAARRRIDGLPPAFAWRPEDGVRPMRAIVPAQAQAGISR
jgi:hypothetical protein